MIYSNEYTIKILTKEIEGQIPDEHDYMELLLQSINHAERKVKSKLRENNIPFPERTGEVETDDPIRDIMDASNLYAAAFIYDTYYAGNETPSPASKSYKTDADEFLNSYIQWYTLNNQETHSGIEIGMFTINHETYEDD